MAAGESLHPIQFQRERQAQDSQERYFHGSNKIFAPGQTVDPTPDRLYGGEDKVYVSGPDAPRGLAEASRYAWMKAVPGKVTEPHQGQLFAAAHEVRPRSFTPVANQSAMVHGSTEPADVVGVAAWVRTDDMGAKDVPQMHQGNRRDFL